MRPSYPASTFPNHYTLATGLTPDQHGIINNVFWVEEMGKEYTMSDMEMRNNPDYYGGEPIWTTAKKQGVITGNLYWVGSDIAIKGEYPHYYKVYAHRPRLSYEARIDTAIQWLQKPIAERPRLIMLYIEQPDGVGHSYGPTGKETGRTILYLDSLVGDLRHKLAQLPIGKQINLIVTSDHGMADIDNEQRYLSPDKVLKPTWYKRIVAANPSFIFAEEAYHDSIIRAFEPYAHITAYKRGELPAELGYGTHRRMGDIVVVPDCGWQFAPQPRGLKGAHGYSQHHPDMQVAFRAVGPDFKQNYRAEMFENVDIYLLLSHLLNIKPAATSGRSERILPLLKRKSSKKSITHKQR